MFNVKKPLSALLASLMLLSGVTVFAGCAKGDETPDNAPVTTAPTEEETGEVDHRFDGIKFGGREFRIYTSAASNGLMDSSNFLIEGEGKTGGGLVSDAVFARNVAVEEALKVKLVFTQCELGYGNIAADIRKYTQSGDDEFDLVINDNYDYAPLMIEGNFRNLLDEDCVFDFNREYWYKDYMDDLILMNGYQYLMAGDYFIDVLRTAHLLMVNKNLYKEYYQSSADELYDVVMNYEWTYDKLNTLISDIYTDRNNNGEKDAGDLFGFADGGTWGASIAFSASGTTNFFTRDEDGIPTLTLHEGDRANQLANAITTLFNNESSSLNAAGGAVEVFTRGDSLVAGGFFLGTLESEALRLMEDEAAVLPYPMLFASDKKYTTATHDTTELGAILITSTDLNYISTVIEVLGRETAKIVIPKYYKESLQVQCVDDEKAAAMIDIIHDNFDNAFVLAFNTALGGRLLQAFSDCAEKNREFSAVFAGSAKSVQNSLKVTIKKFQKNNNVD